MQTSVNGGCSCSLQSLTAVGVRKPVPALPPPPNGMSPSMGGSLQSVESGWMQVDGRDQVTKAAERQHEVKNQDCGNDREITPNEKLGPEPSLNSPLPQEARETSEICTKTSETRLCSFCFHHSCAKSVGMSKSSSAHQQGSNQRVWTVRSAETDLALAYRFKVPLWPLLHQDLTNHQSS